MMVNNEYLETQVPKKAIDFKTINYDNFNEWNTIKSDPFSVKPNTIYNYELTLEAKNVNPLRADIYYLKDPLRLESQDKNHPNATNSGKGVKLNSQSELFTKVEILKNSNYTTAVKVRTCESCNFLKISIGDEAYNISLHNRTQFKWFYHTNLLEKGEYRLKIYSDSVTDLESVLIYSTENESDETLSNVFNPKESAAELVQYTKINPTKYVAKINSVRPYVLSLAESHDAEWKVYVDGVRANDTESMPMYSILNGFYIDTVGYHNISIEYVPQTYFTVGLALSLVTVFFSIIGYYLFAKRKPWMNSSKR
jgi:hypothetical protein